MLEGYKKPLVLCCSQYISSCSMSTMKYVCTKRYTLASHCNIVKTPPCQPCPSPVITNAPHQYSTIYAIFNQTTTPHANTNSLTGTPSYYWASSVAAPDHPFRFHSCFPLCSPYLPQRPSHSARP